MNKLNLINFLFPTSHNAIDPSYDPVMSKWALLEKEQTSTVVASGWKNLDTI